MTCEGFDMELWGHFHMPAQNTDISLKSHRASLDVGRSISGSLVMTLSDFSLKEKVNKATVNLSSEKSHIHGTGTHGLA